MSKRLRHGLNILVQGFCPLKIKLKLNFAMDSVLTKTQRKLHVEKSPANCAESQGRILDKGVISNHTSDKFIYFDVRNGIFCKLYRTTN